MGLENPTITTTLVATEAMTASQFCLVKLVSGTNFGGGIATAATDVPGGVQQNKAASGGAVSVCVSGISKVVLGGTVAVGARLTATTAGAAIATTTDKDNVWGVALQAGDSGDIITMLVAGFFTLSI